jgi:hypothetical protein
MEVLDVEEPVKKRRRVGFPMSRLIEIERLVRVQEHVVLEGGGNGPPTGVATGDVSGGVTGQSDCSLFCLRANGSDGSLGGVFTEDSSREWTTW